MQTKWNYKCKKYEKKVNQTQSYSNILDSANEL